jgi:hypothetical protein
MPLKRLYSAAITGMYYLYYSDAAGVGCVNSQHFEAKLFLEFN